MPPPTVFINGVSGTGKTLVLQTFLRTINHLRALSYAYVNCIEVQHAPRLLFERILRQLRGVPPEDGTTFVKGNDSLHDFIRLLGETCQSSFPCGLADSGCVKNAMDPSHVWPVCNPGDTRYIVCP